MFGCRQMEPKIIFNILIIITKLLCIRTSTLRDNATVSDIQENNLDNFIQNRNNNSDALLEL